jgi:predicted xylose isomerase-like sugar epimerase
VSIFKSTNVLPLVVKANTLAERSGSAYALADYAMDRFTVTANDLEEAAAMQEDVAAEAGAEILVLQDLADQCLSERDSARSAASKIRAIFA